MAYKLIHTQAMAAGDDEMPDLVDIPQVSPTDLKPDGGTEL